MTWARNVIALGLLVGLLLSFLWPAATISASAQSYTGRHLTLTAVLTIGDDESRGAESLFVRPSWLALGPGGTVYVADTDLSVRVFGADGAFLRAIGSRGDGPGEFQHLSSFAVGAAGEVVAFDGRLNRLTVFDAAGVLASTRQVPRTELIWPRRLAVRESGEVAFLASLPERSSRDPRDSGNLLHTYPPDSSSKTGRALPRTLLGESERDAFYRSQFDMNPGNLAFGPAGLCWAPGLYEGRIHCRHDDGYASLVGAVTQSSAETADCDSPPRAGRVQVFRASEPTEVCGYLRVLSAGLHRLRDGRLLHLVYQSEAESGRLRYELFGSDGVLGAEGVLSPGGTVSWFYQPPIFFPALEGDRFLWAIQFTEQAWVVRKYEIVIHNQDVQ